MRWDLVGSSLRDSPKGSGSSLGTRREIAGKKIEGLTQKCRRLLDYAGNPGSGQHFRQVNRPGRWVNRPYLNFHDTIGFWLQF
ncbi:hypothetical protein GW17_00034187 [Ensete ventricosum]|nr:hypothetical protein GW17_00034187 [Ensete ventricosum]